MHVRKAKHFPVRDVLPGLVLVLGAAYAIGRILSGAVSPDSGPADTSGSAREPIAIVQGTEVTELYEGYLWAQYLEDSDGLVVNADCVPLEDLLPETAGEFPVLTLDAPLSLQIPADLSPFEIAVYSDAFEPEDEIHLTWDNLDIGEVFPGLCDSLSSGTHYIIISASQQGEYLEKAEMYESFGYEYAFTLEVP